MVFKNLFFLALTLSFNVAWSACSNPAGELGSFSYHSNSMNFCSVDDQWYDLSVSATAQSCTVDETGAMNFVSSGTTDIQYCRGSTNTWVSMGTPSSNGTCSTSGAIRALNMDVLSLRINSRAEWCDGSVWRQMKNPKPFIVAAAGLMIRGLVICSNANPAKTFSLGCTFISRSVFPSGGGNVRGLSFSPDGLTLAAAYSGAIPTFANTINATSFATSSTVGALAGQSYAVAYSPDGTMLAYGYTASPYITVFNTSTGAAIGAVPSLTQSANTVAFSPDSSVLAIGRATTPRLTFYRTSDWSTLSTPTPVPTATVNGVAFSPNGQFFAAVHSTSSSYSVSVYNTNGNIQNPSLWTRYSNVNVSQPGSSNAVSFSPDSSKMAVALNVAPYVALYNTGSTSFTRLASPTTVLSAAADSVDFSADGTYYAVAGGTSTGNKNVLIIYNVSGTTTVSGSTVAFSMIYDTVGGSFNTVAFPK